MANLCLHNRDFGMTEALCRGFRTGFLSDADYHHLTQCETLEDVKMNLAETDYDAFLQDCPAVTPAVVLEKATAKMVAEFQFLRAQAVEPLSQFLDFITWRPASLLGGRRGVILGRRRRAGGTGTST